VRVLVEVADAADDGGQMDYALAAIERAAGAVMVAQVARVVGWLALVGHPHVMTTGAQAAYDCGADRAGSPGDEDGAQV
jgi:hypothetical protein